MSLAGWALLFTVVPVVGTSGPNKQANSLYLHDTFSAAALTSSRQLNVSDKYESRALWQVPTWTGDVRSPEDFFQQLPIIVADGSLPKETVDVSSSSIDKEETSERGPRLLIIGLFVALVLMRENVLGSLFCRECEDLREHLNIAARILARARENWLTTASATINTADEEVLTPINHFRKQAAQVRILSAAILDHHRTRHAKLSYCRQCEDLREHVLIASLKATQDVEMLRAAIDEHCRARHAKRLYCRECEELNEHHIIALRKLASAGDSMVAAIVLKSLDDPEVRRLERKVEILAEAVAHHRMGHQCPHQQQTLKTYRLAIP